LYSIGYVKLDLKHIMYSNSNNKHNTIVYNLTGVVIVYRFLSNNNMPIQRCV